MTTVNQELIRSAGHDPSAILARATELGKFTVDDRKQVAQDFFGSVREKAAALGMEPSKRAELCKKHGVTRTSDPHRWASVDVPVIVALCEAIQPRTFERRAAPTPAPIPTPAPAPIPTPVKADTQTATTPDTPGKDTPVKETTAEPSAPTKKIDVPAVVTALGIEEYVRELAESVAEQRVVERLKEMKVVKRTWEFQDVKVAVEPGEATHAAFEHVCEKIVSVRSGAVKQAVYLYGPSGCGKTFMVQQIAKKLECAYYEVPGGADLEWHHVAGEFRVVPDEDSGQPVMRWFDGVLTKAARHGGIVLIDELDRCLGEFMVKFNGVTSNWTLAIPETGEIIECHPGMVIIGTGNTRLTGATRKIATAQVQDGALITRLMAGFVEMGYDENMERLLGAPEEVISEVQALRKIVRERNVLDDEGAPLDVGTRFITGAMTLMQQHKWSAKKAVQSCTGLWSDGVRERCNLPKRAVFGS
jgi:hypothetical protein